MVDGQFAHESGARATARGLARLALGLGLGLAAACAAAAPIVHRLGSAANAHPALHGPAFYLKGDGAPEPRSFARLVEQVADGPVDVMVLGASYPNYEGECEALVGMAQVNSCTTVVVREVADAYDPAVLEAVRNTEVIYFRGGNQCNLVAWRDTPLQQAVIDLVARGGGTGGGSAGLAIQGALAVYDGCQGSARSASALANPYGPGISFAASLFDWAPLGDTLTDSHFVQRDRMGRLMAFLCRQLAGGRHGDVWGLGIDEGSAVVIDRDGVGTVYGDVAYMVRADQGGSSCEDDRDPVTYLGFQVWRLPAGSRYDFADRPRSGYYRIDVVEGVLSADPYSEPAEASPGTTVAGGPAPAQASGAQ